MRTTSGTDRFTALQAVITPVAMVSHFMMPPKMLTRMPLDVLVGQHDLEGLGHLLGGWRRRPHPGSYWLAAEQLDGIHGAMARPAPLTRQPMLPSRLM